MRHPSHYWIIEPKLWSTRDNIEAQNEGWVLSRLGDIFMCSLPTETAKYPFHSSREATAYVQRRADKGSEFHTRAMLARTAAKLHPKPTFPGIDTP